MVKLEAFASQGGEETNLCLSEQLFEITMEAMLNLREVTVILKEPVPLFALNVTCESCRT